MRNVDYTRGIRMRAKRAISSPAKSAGASRGSPRSFDCGFAPDGRGQILAQGDDYHAWTPMATNVLIMPDPSDKTTDKKTSDAGSGHRSTARGSEMLAADAGRSARTTQAAAEPSTEVFAVFGVEPEIQAYAMAKYSRSSLSMKESLREISSQKAEKFLNTFYFQYGHRSIADLAHIALAVERLSILAAIELADEQRWDGQERSTRYQ